MASSIRCRVTGCDRDDCGVCRRCGDDRGAKHAWKEASRSKPCFPRMLCERCQAEKESPDHDWQIGAANPQGDVTMECSRCRLRI